MAVEEALTNDNGGICLVPGLGVLGQSLDVARLDTNTGGVDGTEETHGHTMNLPSDVSDQITSKRK